MVKIKFSQLGNDTLIDAISKELPQSTFYWMLISLVLAVVWIVYLTYYNSRVMGLILTAILNRFVKVGHVKFGSFSFSVLSGKIMFRDVHLITVDFSIRIQLGMAIFRWWRPLTTKTISEDLIHEETRLSVYLDSFELHVYNRSETYARLEELFGLEKKINLNKDEDKGKKKEKKASQENTEITIKNKWLWRTLVPVIKVEISSGRIVFGNYLVPTTLSVNFGDSHFLYSTKQASTPFDFFMHIVKGKMDNIRIMMVPSPKYKPQEDKIDEPPRYMGDGFVVFQSQKVEIYYFRDEPGFVPYEVESLQMANGDILRLRTWPVWGVEVKCDKMTDISYGPWADRQREYLWRFFFPPDYQTMQPTKLPEPGDVRIWKNFDFKMSLQNDASIDILFTKNKETQALHMNCKKGSYLEFTIPWIIDEHGYQTKISSLLIALDTTTSLSFRSLLECETLQVDVEANFPRHWNDHQTWQCDIRASKATLSLIYHHKHFFVDLVDDWSSKSVPDVYRFVPYTWKVNVILQEFELITLTNQWNWIDCHGATPENAHLAVCGDTFDLSFTLPFDDFLPPLLPIKIFIRGEAIEVRLYLAETNTSFHFLQALADNCRRLGRDGNIYDGPLGYQNNKKWRRITHRSSGWVDCWLTPIVALSINYTYHPVAPVSKVEKYMTFESLSTPDAEEMLLIPLRLNPVNPFKQKMKHLMQMEFDPTEMDADEISVELEVGPSEICIYGALLKNLWHVKENYFGDDQKFTDFKETAQDANSLLEHILARESNNKPIDPRRYRPLHIRVQVVLHDLHGHLMKHCNEGDPPCPSIFLERLCFEMDKRYTETKLQVMLSPVVVYIRDSYEKRPSAHSHLKDGHLVLSALQIRGNAMFSHRGLPLDSETLEYCWLLEVTIGDLVGRLTAPQLQALTEGLQTLAFGIEDAENNLQHAKPFKLCQHGLPQSECTFDPSNSPCITSDDIKYRMTRVTMDCVDLYLVESGTALNIQIYPIRLSTCNLHGRNNKAGITALVPNVKVKQFVLSIPVDDPYNSQTDIWLEAGGVCFGPVNVDAAMALPGPEFHHLQDQFLKLHDEKTHRLWFLWPKEDLPKNVPTHGKCGCVGGCAFFGTNRNGPHVFHPSDSDFQESLNSAVYHVCPEEVGFGFGQSLLQKGQLIFTANSGMSTFPMFWSQSRVHSQLPEDLSSHQESDINMEGNSTLVNVSPPSKVDSTADQNDKESQEKTKESLKPEDSFLSECTLVASMDLGNVREKSASLASSSSSSLQQTCVPGNPVTHVSSDNAPSDSVPSDYMPDSSIPDAYDTDRYVSTPSDVASWPSVASGSSGSLPDITTSQKDKGHERKLSDQPPVGLRHGQHSEQFQQQKQSPQQQPASGLPGSINSSVSSESRRSSKNSIPSLEGTSGSRHSSLTSPVLRRLSSQLSFQREGSIPSMTGSGSERFFSAAEDLASSVQTLNSYIQGADLTSPFGSIQYPQGLGQTGSAFSDAAAAALQQDHSCSPENVSLSSSYYGDIDSPHSSMYVHQEQSESDNSSQSSHSSGSFVSAVSSQEASHHSINQLLSGSSSPTINADDQETILTDECDPELDVNLPMASNYVNLHGQMNKPITKSVLLIQCYTRYMMQLKCSYWSAPPPLSSHMLQCRASENGQAPESIKQSTAPLSDMVGKTQAPAWIPHFSYLNDGFTPKLMVNKKEMKSPPSLSPPNGATARSGRSRQFFPSEDQIQEEDLTVHTTFSSWADADADSLFTYENHVSKTTAIVNLKGSIDIMVSPLMVEALQRYLEAVTPVLQSLHPSTIVDAMHFKVVSSVKAQNKLKQEEDNGDMTEKKDEKEKNIQKEQNQEDLSVDVDDLKSKTSRLQVMFSLSRVNICFMQASLVEELVSISALDHAQDLTCVSLLSACLDNISCQLLMNNISQKTLKVMTESSPDSSTKKNQMKPGSPRIQLFKETSVLSDSGENQRLVERQQEDMVGSLSVSRVHLQLRRMKHGSNSLNNIYLTAIPEYRSKVLFTFEKPNVPLGGFTGTGTLAPHAQTQTGAEESGPRTREFDQEGAVAEDVAGFIMFECGLEDISLRAARRTGYADATEAQESDDGIQQVKEHMEFMESASHCFKNEAWKDTSPTSESKQTNSPSDGNGTSENSGNTADDEASGPSGQGKENTDKMGDGSENVTGRSNEPTHGSEQEFHGDASSAVLQVKSVWFNFAAPPPSLKKKKLEYTRYDWNLLSTATPAINAWMNPTHHVVMAAKTLIDKLNERICVVMACMMTEGPETSGIHNRVKSKVNKLTSLSSTLQEDPSCQLLTALRRYIKKVGVKVIEESVRADAIPQLVTIKKGLLVMTRQWKTILYMPRQVADNNFKSKRKIYSVNFTLPQDKSLDHISPMAAVDEWDTSADNFMVVDEKTSLLKAEGESVHTPSVYSIPACPVGSEAVKGDPHSQTPFFKQISKQKSSNPSQLSGSINSLSSADQPGTLPSAPDTPHRQSLTGHLSELDRGSGKDIGSWMRQQQQYVAEHYQQGFYGYPSMGQDSLTNAGLSEYSHDESMSLAPCIMHPAVQIQDAQVLFKPLLKAIGLQTEAVKMSAVMMKFGGNISVRSHLDTLQVEIIDSEMRSIAKSKGKGKGRGKRAARLLIATGTDKPAFQTHALAFMVDMKDIIDFEKSKQEKKESDLIEMHQKSLRTLKLMMDEMEAKPTTTQVNFSFNCNSVMQHINMPLLRLVHQFVTMIENIHKTQKELREQASNVYTRHKKQDSKGSSTETGTDIHSIDQLEEEHPPTSDLSTNVQTPMSSDVPSPAARPSNLPLKVSVSDQPVRPNVLGSGTSKAHKLSWRKSKHESLHSKQNYSDFKEDMLNSPIHSIDSVTIDMVDTSSPALAEKTIVDQICESTPVCWIKLYHILNLYSTMPDMKMVTKKPSQSRLSVIAEESEKASQNQSGAKPDSVNEKETGKDLEAIERQPRKDGRMYSKSTFKHSLLIGGEQVPLIVFGIAKLQRIKITAVLSGLTLEADLQNVHGSATHREKVKGVPKKKSRETSASAHVGHAMVALIEGNAPDLQTIVAINISQSHGLYSSISKRSHEFNSGLLTVGCIDVDIPQHPVALHGVVARSSKRLSCTLQEFIRVPSKSKSVSHDTPDGSIPTQPASKHSELSDYMSMSTQPKDVLPSKPVVPQQPLTIHFKAILKGLTVGASLLPSLKAEYKMGTVFSSGITGKKPRFTLDLPVHSLSFESKISTPSNLPSSASVVLPPIHVHGDYKEHAKDPACRNEGLAEGLTLREGPYLNAVAEVGAFEHSLTTDLLNHLVFVQKVFMKEVNELVQKVSGADKPVPLWPEESVQARKGVHKPLLYHFRFRLKGIQITATTPTDNAVRLETDMIELELSNRVLSTRHGIHPTESNYKVFVKAQVDLNVALGTLMKNPLFDEAEPDFPQLASFNTTISLRNALQEELIPGVSKDQEALLISLKRPIVFIQPAAFDKAVLVWLNYKNAYEYWNEQRMVLNKEIQKATQQFIDRLPLSSIAHSSTSTLGTLYLQLTVDDLGICLPANPFPQGVTTTSKVLEEPGASLVLTLQQTQISACSYGSLVSKGKFTGFCLRFDEDFEKSWDDWKPNNSDKIVMNAMVVPEGTYEVCSRTINPQANDKNSNAKVILNVKWHMKGLDVNMDTNIGKRLSQLGNTLTSLTSDPDVYFSDSLSHQDHDLRKLDDPNTICEELLNTDYGADMNSKQWTRLIEKKMNDQAKVVEDLKQLGASQNTIEIEERKLRDLKVAVCHDFRQEFMKKLRSKSAKASALRDKLGLGYKPSQVAKPKGFPSHAGYHRTMTYDVRKLATYKEESDKELFLQDSSHKHGRALSLGAQKFSTPKSTWDHSQHSIQSDYTSKTEESPPTTPPYITLRDDTSSGSDDSDPDLAFYKSTSFRPRAHSDSRSQNIPSPSQGSGGSQKTHEPNVDFELDVKVQVDSGMCVLHPKEIRQEGDSERLKGVRSQKDLHQVSPQPEHKKLKKKYVTESLLGSRQHQPQPLSNVTTFVLPGVDVKVHWNSKTSSTMHEVGDVSVASSTGPDTGDTHLTPGGSGTGVTTTSKKTPQKKASLYAWLSLQQLPEMLIRPVLLDFLEQALESIPIVLSKNSSKNSTLRTPIQQASVDLDNSASSLVSSASYSSFPVDVVVYLQVKPSLIRFTCLPVSRVECLLRLPSLDVVFSTKKADFDEATLSETSVSSKSKVGMRLSSSTSNLGLRSGKTPNVMRSASGHQQEILTTSGGGLSVTACLADFSLYVFHPYGGGHKERSLSALENKFKKNRGADGSHSNATNVGRKDSLSLNVEFVKVNLSRSRKGVLQADLLPSGSSTKLGGVETSTKAANSVRFSAVCDVGSASFKYDMRRLSEILALPKAWYRRALARRMFLGEERAVVDSEEEDDDDVSLSSSPSPESPLFSPYGRAQTFNTVHYPNEKPTNHRRVASADRNMPETSELKRGFLDYSSRPHHATGSAPQSPGEDRQRVAQSMVPPSTPSMLPLRVQQEYVRMRERDLQPQGYLRPSSQFTAPVTLSLSQQKSVRDWETLVLFAVNLSRLDVIINMSNVMGNTVWSTKDLKCEGSVSMDSTGAKNMTITAGLGGSKLEAKGGIVGGTIALQTLHSSVSIKEEPSNEPVHRAGFQLETLETRIDYMGSSILMGRTSKLCVELKDEWKIQACRMDDSDPDMVATRRPATIFVFGELEWDKFHLMISRSTTPDLIKMVAKIEEFFVQQLNSSKRVLSAFGPMPGSGKAKKKKDNEEASWISEIRHHRHWQNVLEHVSGCKLSMLSFTLPSHRSTVGGSMSLKGHNLSLACFHGINFRSKSWGLFTMDEPYIVFNTEAQEVVDDDGAKCTHVEQTLQFHLGHEHRDQHIVDRKDMAMVCKLSRGHYMPPSMTNIQDWFHYALATSEIRDLDSFPQMAREGSESPQEHRMSSRRGQEYNHDTEVIFVLPRLLMVLKTRHLQGEHEPAEDDPKPKVECSFVTDFYHHINVAMDAEAILFIHDLVTSYVREKDKGASRMPKSPETERKEKERKNVSNPTAVLKQDYREFQTISWRLEPTVNLLTWAGKKIDPVGVDFILQKLGFQHARLTIPKWMQRGCMDPLDKMLSVLVNKLVLLLKEHADNEDDDDDDSDNIV